MCGKYFTSIISVVYAHLPDEFLIIFRLLICHYCKNLVLKTLPLETRQLPAVTRQLAAVTKQIPVVSRQLVDKIRRRTLKISPRPSDGRNITIAAFLSGAFFSL